MSLTSDLHLRARAKAVFMDIVDAPAAGHAALLDRLCSGDPVLRREVEQLLAAVVAADNGFNAPSVPISERDDVIGAHIGPYHVLERIGEGGFGSVYMAEQITPVTRRVAIKIIKLGMDTRQVIARFEAERQALAMMDHPSIARVLDAGSTQAGRPYFVMELVKGIPIAQYCDAHNLTTSERLELFSNVCLAVQHAHTKGIIHRDIKPSNVLVTVADGRPLPKVIDFGIAKATGGRLTDKTLFTEFRQLIGTPEYMSPEQAESRGVDVDARTDIYSLGVLLYELLTGTTPFDASRLRSASFEELHRIIREEDPPKPSNRVSRQSATFLPASPTQSATSSLSDIARRRRVEPGQLIRNLRGELDWIVMKAMDKDRARRYDTASSFAADIGRFLRNEPIQAAPPGATYRTRKLIRRNRVAFSAAAAILLTLVLGLGAALIGFSRASRESKEKEIAYLAEAEQRREAQSARNLADKRTEEARREAYHASIRAASAALSIGDQANAELSLAAAPTDLRGWEWNYLFRTSDLSIHTFSYSEWNDPHAGPVSTGLLPPQDGRSVKLRRRDGSPLSATLPESLGQALQVTMSSDGNRALIPCTHGCALVNMGTGDLVVLSPLILQSAQQAFSADGTWLVGVTISPRRVAFFDSATGRETRSIPLPFMRSRSFAALSPDGTRVAVELDDGIMGLLDAKSGDILWKADGVQSRFSADGKRVYVLRDVMSQATSLVALETSSGIEIGRASLQGSLFQDSGMQAGKIALSPDGALIAVLSDTGAIRLLDASTFAVITHLSAPGTSHSVSFSGDSRRLYCETSNGLIKSWDSAIANSPLRSDSGTGPIAGNVSLMVSAISPDGTRAFTGDWGRLMLWDTTTGMPFWSRFHNFEFVKDIAWHPDARKVAVVSERGTLSLLDPANGDLIASSHPLGYGEFGSQTLGALAWSTDSKVVYTGGASGDVVACDALTLMPASTFCHTGVPVTRLRPSPDGRALAIISSPSGTVSVYSTEAKFLWSANFKSPSAAAWSPDSGRLAVADETQIVLLDAATGSAALHLETTPGTYTSLAFANRSHRLVGSRADRRLQIWSSTTGESLLALESPALSDITFSPDESAIVGSGNPAAIRFEQTPPGGDVLWQREILRRALVEISRRTGRLLYPSDVADSLRGDQSVVPDVRRTALLWLETVGQHAAALTNDAYLNAAHRNPENIDRALRDSELAVTRCPDAFALNTRGIVLYRAGRFSEALEWLERAEKAYRETRLNWGDGAPSLEAFRCMALFHVGRVDEARTSLAQLRKLVQSDRYRNNDFAPAFLAEADELIAAAK